MSTAIGDACLCCNNQSCNDPPCVVRVKLFNNLGGVPFLVTTTLSVADTARYSGTKHNKSTSPQFTSLRSSSPHNPLLREDVLGPPRRIPENE